MNSAIDDNVAQTAAIEAGDYSEFKDGWQVVIASLLGIGLGLSPMPFYTMGVFAPHLAREFGWSIGQIMGGLAMTTLMVLWAAPAVGMLATRIGVRRVAMASLLLFGLSFMSLALSTGSITQFYITWALIATLGAGTLPITWTKSVNHWFDRRKGLALGLSLMGTGLFGIFSKPYLAWIIGSYGWRAGYVGLGLLPILVALPTAYFLLRDPDTEGKAATQTHVAGGYTLKEALRQWRFWVLAVVLVPLSYALGGPIPNLEGILRLGGVTPATILTLTPLVGLSSLIGRLVGGWLLDRFWAPAVSFVILGLPAVSCYLLAGSAIDYTSAAAAIFLIGFALGVEYDVVAYFVARYFGLSNYSSIYGVLYIFFALGAGVGPLGFGMDFDAHGNYHLSLISAAILIFGSAALLLTFGRYKQFDDVAVVR